MNIDDAIARALARLYPEEVWIDCAPCNGGGECHWPSGTFTCDKCGGTGRVRVYSDDDATDEQILRDLLDDVRLGQ